MKTFVTIFYLWIVLMGLIVAGALSNPSEEWGHLVNIASLGSSALLGLTSCFLYVYEMSIGTRFVFLNCAVFFGGNGIATPLFQLAILVFVPKNEWARFYFYEYNLLTYIVLLQIVVVFVVFNYVFRNWTAWRKYGATLILVGGVTMVLFGSFLKDPMYLTTLPQLKNLKAVHISVERMRQEGNLHPSVEQIASHANLQSPGIGKEEMDLSQEQRIAFVQEVLPYNHGDDAYMLFYRPLWRSCVKMSLITLFALVILVICRYLVDSPEGAYMEKIAWCLLPYSCFEVLHYYGYAQTQSYDRYMNFVAIGGYVSMSFMWLLCVLFALRLHFIKSVEGGYYERRLIEGPEGITRWRDAFDNWVVRQFMNQGELERRFLIQRNSNKGIDG